MTTIVSSVNVLTNDAEFKIYVNNILTEDYLYSNASATMQMAALSTATTLSLTEWQTDILALQTWATLIKTTFNPPIVQPITSTANYSRTSVPTYDLTCTISGYAFEVKYTYNTTRIRLFPTLLTTITWGDFLVFLDFQNQFLKGI